MKITRYIPTLIVVGVILYATLNEDPLGAASLPPIPHIDKLIHAILFGGLAGAWTFDRCRANLPIGSKNMMILCVICAIGGVANEILQTYCTNGRAGNVEDWLADVVGIVVAYFSAPPAVRAVLRRKDKA